MISYVAIISDLRARTTTRESFRAPDYLAAKARYKGVGNVDSHVGPVTVRIVGVVPLSTVRAGQVVTMLGLDATIETVGHVVTERDNDPRRLCIFE